MGRRVNGVGGGETAEESGGGPARPNLAGDLDELLGIRPLTGSGVMSPTVKIPNCMDPIRFSCPPD